ncbi:MAG: pectin-derived oligosaccharide transport system substrate-binding protein [Micromonosporaceae bacterium]
MRVRIIALLVSVLAAGAGCGSGGGGTGAAAGPVTIRFTWWGNADRAAVTEQAVKLFEQKNTGIKVETSFAEFNAYFQKLATQIAGGAAPDVLQMDYRYVREYGDRGVLADLGSGQSKVDTSGVTPQLLSGGTVDGKLLGIPPTQNTQEFTYDPAAWQQAGAAAPRDGWTWSDLKTAAGKVSKQSGGKVRGVVDFGPIEDWYEVWLRQQGKSLYTADGKLGYTAGDVAAWWQLASDLRTSGASTPPEVTAKLDGSQANDPVAKKTASAGFGYDSGFTPKTWEIYGRTLKLAPFPSDSGKLGQYAKPAMMFSVAQHSAHKDAAAKLINFLVNDAQAGTVLGMSRGLPANQQVRRSVGAALTGPPQVSYAFEQQVGPKLDQAPPPPPKGAGTVKAAFQRIYDEVMFGRSSPQQAAERFMTEARQALSA